MPSRSKLTRCEKVAYCLNPAYTTRRIAHDKLLVEIAQTLKHWQTPKLIS